MYRKQVSVPAYPSSVIISYDDVAWGGILDAHGERNAYSVYLITSSWIALLGDTPLQPDYLHTGREIRSFFRDLISDLFGVIGHFDVCLSLLTTQLVEQDGALIVPFIPEFQDTPIFKEFLEFRKDTSNFTLLRYILSFLNFGRKLYYEDEHFHVKALRSWHETEERLRGLQLDPTDVKILRHILNEVFNNWVFPCFLPSHGGGKVSQVGISSPNEKNQAIANHPRISRMINDLARRMGLDEHVFYPEYMVPDSTPSIEEARVKFVPNTWKKSRTICMEPIIFQWAQQGVRLVYEHYIRSAPLLKSAVTIHDQSNNQDGALFGSDVNYVDTLDLSSASDSVSWTLVKGIFPPKVCKLLAATRTVYVDTREGEPVRVEKFAPMGSALCFPVQSTIYTAIIIACILEHAMGRERLLEVIDTLNVGREVRELVFDHYTYQTNKLQPYRVYGDDIICDTRITSLVIGMLRRCGFIINVDKSFIGDQKYRESCGKHYCDGNDVTPFYLKTKVIGRKVSIASLASVIDACNRALEFGYLNLRRHLKNFILYYPIVNHKQDSKGRNSILFSSNEDDSYAILCNGPRNNHLRKRCYEVGHVLTDKDISNNDTRFLYQRDEVSSIVVAEEDSEEPREEFDNYYYLLWQRSRYPDVEIIDEIVDGQDLYTSGIRIRRRWTPT